MWYEKFDSHIRNLGYYRSDSNPCLYVKSLLDESRIYLILYVDDTVITGKDRAEITELKEKLHEKYSMKELENVRYIFGMRIEQNRL